MQPAEVALAYRGLPADLEARVRVALFEGRPAVLSATDLAEIAGRVKFLSESLTGATWVRGS